ncbi:MAG: hypothetical protein QF473_17620 [Planctomycetota bacterium]|nr:hypothetical protein [Planctomycetota bacterium]
MNCRNILLIRSDQSENAYGRFTLEILKAEGLMGFEVVDLARHPLPQFRPSDLLILSRCFLRKAELETVLAAVENGAGAVVLQPQQRLIEALGAQPMLRVVHPAFVGVAQSYPGPSEPLQTHVPVQAHDLGASKHHWEQIAETFTPDWANTGVPAVARARIGKGRLACFFYDLPEAVARIRFGNPNLASYTTSETWAWVHPCDMFHDHVDDRLMHLPQADYHGQLLARVLTDAAPFQLPRLWYYPESQQRTVAVFQSDGDHSEPQQFEELASSLEARDATATFYLMKTTKLDEEAVANFRSRGHTFGPHVNPRSVGEEMVFAFPEAMEDECRAFEQRFGERTPTLQCHCGPWHGRMDLLPLHLQYGYRLLFAHIPGPMHFWNRYMCGTGRPMKFFDDDGRLYDCWQQPLTFYDDATLVDKISNQLDEICQDFETILKPAIDTNHTAVALLSHPVSYSTYSRPFMDKCFDRFVEEGIPIMNADEWLDFIDCRDAVRVNLEAGEDGKRAVRVSGLRGRLPLMIPTEGNGGQISALVDGRQVDGVRQSRLGCNYLFIPLEGNGSEILVTLE